MSVSTKPKRTAHWRLTLTRVIKHKTFYIMLIPGLIYVFLFHYVPIGNLVIAFQDFKLFKGIAGSPWVGFENFINLFQSRTFYQLLRNTIIISFSNLIIGYPAAILLALLINEVNHVFIKRFVQTVVYLPHFLSWVVVAALASTMLSLDDGVINVLIEKLGGTQKFFLGDVNLFRYVVVAVYVWKESGWNAIIYLAALSGISPEL